MNKIIERSTQDPEGTIICKGSSTVPAIPHKAKMTYITVPETPRLVYLAGDIRKTGTKVAKKGVKKW